jgi:hypothetical protein
MEQLFRGESMNGLLWLAETQPGKEASLHDGSGV